MVPQPSNFLRAEESALAHYLPTLAEHLRSTALMDLEAPGSGVISVFRDAGGPGLLIPQKYGGLGVSPLEAARIQRAIGSYSPSLAVASTMHHFSVASLVDLCVNGGGLDWVLLQAIAEQRLLVASGFAEGKTGQNITEPLMRAELVPDGIVVNGSKKPCSLSKSMDLLTASVALEAEGTFGVALIPAASSGMERRPFWKSSVLTGSESDEVILKDVFVPDRLVFRSTPSAQNETTEGFIWFELLIAASYLGMASALIRRVLDSGKGTAQMRTSLAIEAEGAMSAIENVARTIVAGRPGQEGLAQALFVRFTVQRAIENIASQATEVAGGMAFISSPEIAYLSGSTRALAFHPPSRRAAFDSLDRYLAGGELVVN